MFIFAGRQAKRSNDLIEQSFVWWLCKAML